MNAIQAQRVMESLRKGIPPTGFVRHFTVGRDSEIRSLSKKLRESEGGALLIQANYGSGKTHLLQFIREQALSDSYAVSTVTLDARAAVRFNRMDQIFGAICRNIEIPSSPDNKGIRHLFHFLIQQAEDAKGRTGFWHQLTHNWRWDYSEVLDSPAMFIAFRAWSASKPSIQDIIEDYLFQPWEYRVQRKRLYLELVESLRSFFRDPRSEWQFYADEVFMFHTQGYAQSWAALRDLNTLARAAGLKGLTILFDEFEDVITNLRNIAHQQAAFWNLFQFYSGKQFPGMTFYAVTPQFSAKCKNLLIEKNYWDYDFSNFDRLPTFEMSPLDVLELDELAMRVLEAHGIAYNWEPDLVMRASQLEKIVHNAASVPVQDRARHTIISVVKALDNLLQENE